MHRYRRQAHDLAFYDSPSDEPSNLPITLRNPFGKRNPRSITRNNNELLVHEPDSRTENFAIPRSDSPISNNTSSDKTDEAKESSNLPSNEHAVANEATDEIPAHEHHEGTNQRKKGTLAKIATIFRRTPEVMEYDDESVESQNIPRRCLPGLGKGLFLSDASVKDGDGTSEEQGLSEVEKGSANPTFYLKVLWRGFMQKKGDSRGVAEVSESNLRIADKNFESRVASRRAVACLRLDVGQRSIASFDWKSGVPDEEYITFFGNKVMSEQQHRPGLKVVYALDSDDIYHRLLDHFFSEEHGKCDDWIKFREWATTSHNSRGGMKKVKSWKSNRSGIFKRFAFGFEHPSPFVTQAESQDSTKWVRAVQDAKKQGVYDRSKFRKFENHRRTIYINLSSVSGITEQIVIISHNRPCHRAGDELTPVNVTDQSVWQNMVQNTELIDEGYSHTEELATIRVLKNVLAASVAGVLETWNIAVAELDDQFAALEARVYGNPSDDAPAADIWSLSKHLLDMQQSMEAHLDMMSSMQETLNKYILERAPAESVWASESKQPWLEGFMEEMRKIIKTIEDDHIKYASQMIDLHKRRADLSRAKCEPVASELDHVHFLAAHVSGRLLRHECEYFVNNGTSLKWYFIVAVPLMFVIMGVWLLFRHFASRQSKTRMGKELQEKKDA